MDPFWHRTRPCSPMEMEPLMTLGGGGGGGGSMGGWGGILAKLSN